MWFSYLGWQNLSVGTSINEQMWLKTWHAVKHTVLAPNSHWEGWQVSSEPVPARHLIWRSALQKSQPLIAPLPWSQLSTLNFTSFRGKQDKMLIPSLCQKIIYKKINPPLFYPISYKSYSCDSVDKLRQILKKLSCWQLVTLTLKLESLKRNRSCISIGFQTALFSAFFIYRHLLIQQFR